MSNAKPLSISESNDFLIDILRSSKPFLIARPGSESKFAVEYLKSQRITHAEHLSTHNGIYWKDEKELIDFFVLHSACFELCDAIAGWEDLCFKYTSFYLKTFRKKFIHARALEPFYCLHEGLKPWTHCLKDKKVLIIHPFVESFEKQIENDFRPFNDDRRIFLQEQTFLFYKPYNTLAGNHPHKNYKETYEQMCNDISKMDFDIALLACGGYGLLLSHFIRSKLEKSAVYVGGGLQMCFGVLGKRWESHPFWMQVFSESGKNHFVRADPSESIENKEKVEDACYW